MACRHWDQTGLCQMGAKCHFAHGKEELRQMTDPLPPTTDPKVFQAAQPAGPGFTSTAAAMPYSNYKTVKCKYFDQGMCKYGDNCSFAHGDQDMRNFQDNANLNPYAAAQYSQYSMMNDQQLYYNELNKKVVQTQLQHIIASFLNLNNSEIKAKAQSAYELLSSNNANDCITLLNEIIYNPNANPEDKEYFQNLLMEVQVLGNKYYAQLMSLGAGGQQQYGMPGMPGQK